MIRNNPDAVKWLEENYYPITIASSYHGFLELHASSGLVATMKMASDEDLEGIERLTNIDGIYGDGWRVLYK